MDAELDLSFLLQACPRLQVLALVDQAVVCAFSHPATLALDHNHGASLQKLQLRNLQFVDLDLLGALCLSSINITLSHMHVGDDSTLCKLSLPSTLRRFTFEGSYLFAEHGSSVLAESSVMTKLDLTPLWPGTGHVQYGMSI